MSQVPPLFTGSASEPSAFGNRLQIFVSDRAEYQVEL